MTKKQFEEKLNIQYSEISTETLMEQFEYLTIERKGPRCTKTHLREAIENNKVGSIIRKYDPILFRVGYYEQLRK